MKHCRTVNYFKASASPSEQFGGPRQDLLRVGTAAEYPLPTERHSPQYRGGHVSTLHLHHCTPRYRTRHCRGILQHYRKHCRGITTTLHHNPAGASLQRYTTSQQGYHCNTTPNHCRPMRHHYNTAPHHCWGPTATLHHITSAAPLQNNTT